MGRLGPHSASLVFYIILLLILHELSHTLGWLILRLPFRTIKFGVMWNPRTLRPLPGINADERLPVRLDALSSQRDFYSLVGTLQSRL